MTDSHDPFGAAIAQLPANLLSRSPNLSLHGYWINEHRFFWVREDYDAAEQAIWKTPLIVDIDGGQRELLARDEVLAIVAPGAILPIRPDDLHQIAYEMPDRDTLAITYGNATHLVDVGHRVVRKTIIWSSDKLNFSPDWQHGCVLRDGNLWLMDCVTGASRPLTSEGVERNAYGRHPDSCLSTIASRSHPSPQGLWSPNGNWFLTHRIDERNSPRQVLQQNVPDAGKRPQAHVTAYAVPEDEMPMAIYVAIHVASGKIVEFEDKPAALWAISPFAQKRAWFSSDNVAWFVRFDRYCRSAELVRLDLDHGHARVVLSETCDEGYLDLAPSIVTSPNVRILDEGRSAIWYSERDGWGHLYRYDLRTGQVLNRITGGAWQVRSIVDICETTGTILFLAGGLDPAIDPARRTLCSVNMDGTGFHVLVQEDADVYVATREPAGTSALVAYRPRFACSGKGGDVAVVRTGTVNRNTLELFDLRTGARTLLAELLPKANNVTPLRFVVDASDGSRRNHGVLFLPANFDKSCRYPLIDYIYPGPQIAWQPQSLFAVKSLPAMALAELGFITMMLDSRGTPFGSRVSHQSGYPNQLEPQLADHATAVRQLSEQFEFIDGARTGIMGYSGGGSAAAAAMFDYGDIYKVGVSICGNHDNRFYSASWSDKYSGPLSSTDAAALSNIERAGALTGRLLLIHGDMDENVHVSQTLRLTDALIRANRFFDLLIVPNAGHDVMFEPYVQRRIWAHFLEHLYGKHDPVPNFKLSVSGLQRVADVGVGEIPQ